MGCSSMSMEACGCLSAIGECIATVSTWELLVAAMECTSDSLADPTKAPSGFLGWIFLSFIGLSRTFATVSSVVSKTLEFQNICCQPTLWDLANQDVQQTKFVNDLAEDRKSAVHGSLPFSAGARSLWTIDGERAVHLMLLRWGFKKGVLMQSSWEVPDWILKALLRFVFGHLLPVLVIVWLACEVGANTMIAKAAKLFVMVHFLSYGLFVLVLFYIFLTSYSLLATTFFVLPLTAAPCWTAMMLLEPGRVLSESWDNAPRNLSQRISHEAIGFFLLLFGAERLNILSLGASLLNHFFHKEENITILLVLDVGLPFLAFAFGLFLDDSVWVRLGIFNSCGGLLGWLITYMGARQVVESFSQVLGLLATMVGWLLVGVVLVFLYLRKPIWLWLVTYLAALVLSLLKCQRGA